jgi:hypothetical protein
MFREGKMSKRYYYTDAIVALYMMKEFEVLFYLDDGESSTHPFIRNDEDESEIADHELLERCEGYNKIYIEERSEHIFEPKKGDEGRWLRKIGAHYANYNGEQWVSAGIEPNPPKIIMRDNKQFFMPEVENE